MSNNKSCSDCVFWDRNSKDGVCRRHAPVGEMGWPLTFKNDWCGDFERKQDEEMVRALLYAKGEEGFLP